MHSVRSMRKRYSQRHFPQGNPAVILSSIRETHTHHLRLGVLGFGGLPTLAYPLQNVLPVLWTCQHPPLPYHARLRLYLVQLELCDDDFRGSDRDGDGLTCTLVRKGSSVIGMVG